MLFLCHLIAISHILKLTSNIRICVNGINEMKPSSVQHCRSHWEALLRSKMCTGFINLIVLIVRVVCKQINAKMSMSMCQKLFSNCVYMCASVCKIWWFWFLDFRSQANNIKSWSSHVKRHGNKLCCMYCHYDFFFVL